MTNFMKHHLTTKVCIEFFVIFGGSSLLLLIHQNSILILFDFSSTKHFSLITRRKKRKKTKSSSTTECRVTIYKCSICNRYFRNQNALTLHLNYTHNERRDFFCVGCLMPYERKADKIAHENICTNRRYECCYCRKYFTRIRVNMENHVRTHSGEKPFDCEVCNKCFGSKGQRRKHLKNVHNRK